MYRRLTVAVAAIALVVLPVAPSAAAPLPPTDTFFAIPCHEPDLQLYRVNTADSSFTPLGPSQTVGTSECAYQPAYNPATGYGYFLAGNTDDGTWPLVRVNLTTGLYTPIHAIWDGTTNLPLNFAATDFPGNLLITVTGSAFFLGNNHLYPLDLATGIIGPQIGADLAAPDDIYGAACSPVNSTCYVLTELGFLYELDVTTATLGPLLGEIPTDFNFSLQVASDGTLWSSSDATVSSFSAADPAGSFELGADTPLYSGAYLIAGSFIAGADPDPALAATGVQPQGASLAAAALLVAGVVLLARHRFAVRYSRVKSKVTSTR